MRVCCYLPRITSFLCSPPQPSAVPTLISSFTIPPPPTSLPSPTSPSTSSITVGTGGGPGVIGGSSKDRPTPAEAAASNLIISKQALTGKQIASITGCGGTATTASLGQSSLAEDAAYATAPVSNLVAATMPANSLGMGGVSRSSSSAEFVSSTESESQQQGGRSATSTSSSSSSYHLSLGVVASSSSSSTAEQQPMGGSFVGGGNGSYLNNHHAVNGASRDGTSTAMSNSFSGHPVVVAAGGGGGGSGVMGSPSKNLTASPGGGATSSPRPHILRGVKRNHDGWGELYCDYPSAHASIDTAIYLS